jgi:gliding motility-associated-like protein
MKKILTAFIIFFSLSIAGELKATHLMGSDITYKCLGNGRYEVTVTVYRDCNGIPLNNTPLRARCNAGTRTFNLTKISVKDVTGIGLHCPQKSRCSGSYPYGIEEHTFTATIDLSSLNCCEVTLSWEQQARNSAITTGAANRNFYTEAVLNKCVTPCNSSPRFTSKPAGLACLGQDFEFNNGASDTIDVGDSLSYRLVDPLDGQGSRIPYVPPFTAQRPITFLGFTNTNLNRPAGFHFDEVTGDLFFRPIKANEVTVMVIEVTEWRKINGKMEKVGITRRDMQIIVINCGNNKVPRIKGQSVIACHGQQTCVDIETEDLDKDDTTQISWNRGIPRATFTHNNGSKRLASGSVCWTPTINDVSNIPYSFTITVKDNACPRPGQSIRAFSITVRESPEAKIQWTKLDCGKVAVDYTPNKNNYPGLQHEWLVKDSMNRNIAFGTKKQDTLQLQPGNNRLFLTLRTSTPCINAIVDTIPIDPFVQVDLPFDTLICDGNPMTLNAITWDGVPQYEYTWSSGDTGASAIINPGGDSTFWVAVKDQKGCENSDTVDVYWKPLPPVNIGPDLRICYDAVQTLDGGNDTIPYTFLWSNGDTTRYTNISDSNQYVLKLTDSLGCSNYDTMNLFVNEVPVDGGPNPSVCDGDTVFMTATGADTYQWFIVPNLNTPVSTFNQHNFVVKGDREIHIKATRTYKGVTCTNTDTVKVKMNALPEIKFAAINPRCVNDPPFNLTTEGLTWPTITTGTWEGVVKPNIVNGGFFYPDSAGANPSAPLATQHPVKYSVTDNNGCKNAAVLQVPINPLPIAETLDGSYCGYDGIINMGKHIGNGTNLFNSTVVWSSPNTSAQNALSPGGLGDYKLDLNKLAQKATYNLVMRVTSSTTTCINYDTAKITVKEVPNVDAGIPPSLCQNAPSVDLNVVSGAAPTGGTWSQKVGAMGLQGTNFNPNVFPSTATIPAKSWVYYEYDIPGNNCPVTDSMEVTIFPIPQTAIAAVPKQCEDIGFVSVVPYGSPSNGVWSSQGGVISAGGQFDAGNSGPGIFDLKYAVTNLYQCTAEANGTIEIQEKPTLTVVIPPAACENEPFNLSASYSGATGVQWSRQGDGLFNSNPISTVDAPVYQPGQQDNASQKFTIEVFTTNNIANDVCAPASQSFEVKIHPIPTAEILPPIGGCEPRPVDFTALTDQAAEAEYTWNFGDPNSGADNTGSNASETHIYNQQGNYSVNLRVTNRVTSCFKDAGTVVVTIDPTPDADFKMSREVTTVAATDIQFVNLTQVDAPANKQTLDYTWEFGDLNNTNSKAFNPMFEYPTDTGTFIIRLTAITDKGCTSEHIDTLVIGPDITVYIPNAFTPNLYGDDRNNRFYVSAEGYETFEVFIFNRWGEKVYYSTDITEGWDGKYKGETAQQDVYMYVVNVTSYEGKPYTFSGTITLLR